MSNADSLGMRAKLIRSLKRSGSHVCVGLDPDQVRWDDFASSMGLNGLIGT